MNAEVAESMRRVATSVSLEHGNRLIRSDAHTDIQAIKAEGRADHFWYVTPFGGTVLADAPWPEKNVRGHNALQAFHVTPTALIPIPLDSHSDYAHRWTHGEL